MGSVFLSEDEANLLLKRHPRANSFFEEIKQGNIERECYEERCTYEEAREAFENNEKTSAFWTEYINGHQGEGGPGGNWYPFYLAFPLILGLFIILVVILVTWKCLFKKKARRQTAYMRRGARDTDGEAGPLPSGLEHHPHQYGIPLSPLEEVYANAGMPDGFPSFAEMRSDSVTTGLSNCEPPPSYEEATGETGVRGSEMAGQHMDPPPQYEEIASSTSARAITIPPLASNVK